MSAATPLCTPSMTAPSQTISPDGSCGGTNQYTCISDSFGSCCSKYDYCGNTSAYCDLQLGCQSDFGTCSLPQTTRSVDGTCGGTITCSGPGFEGTCCSSSGLCVDPITQQYGECLLVNGCQPSLGVCLQVSPDGSCGGSTNYICTGSTFGICCSEAGWCGSTSVYCNERCQGGAGQCLAPSLDGTCGWDVGFTCIGSVFGECCSGSGWCGNGTDYCSVEKGCFTSGIDNPYLGVCTEP